MKLRKQFTKFYFIRMTSRKDFFRQTKQISFFEELDKSLQNFEENNEYQNNITQSIDIDDSGNSLPILEFSTFESIKNSNITRLNSTLTMIHSFLPARTAINIALGARNEWTC